MTTPVAPSPFPVQPAAPEQPDPPVRDDGRCLVCLEPRHPEKAAKYAREIAKRDPWCSNVCARAWWGNPLPAYADWRNQRKAAA